MTRRNLKLLAAGCNLLFLMPFICYVCGVLFLAGFRDWRQSEKQRANALNDSYLFAIDLQRLFGDEWESSPARISYDQEDDGGSWNLDVAGSTAWAIDHLEREDIWINYRVYTFLNPQAATGRFERYLLGHRSRRTEQANVLENDSNESAEFFAEEQELRYYIRCAPANNYRCTGRFLHGNHLAQFKARFHLDDIDWINEKLPAVVDAIVTSLMSDRPSANP